MKGGKNCCLERRLARDSFDLRPSFLVGGLGAAWWATATTERTTMALADGL